MTFPGHMTNMAAMPIYGENLKKKQNKLFPGTKRPITLKVGTQHRVLEYYQVCSNDDPGLRLTYFTAMSNLIHFVFLWEKDKTMDFSEAVVVCDMKVGRCSQLNEYMKQYEYQRSGSFIDLHRKSLRFNIFKLLFLSNR